MKDIINKLKTESNADFSELLYLIENAGENEREFLAEVAREKRDKAYGNKVFLRGLIEFSNICKNDCYYCGIRKSNKNLERYSLTKTEILSACEKGRSLGFSTFVLQGGERANNKELEKIIYAVKEKYPECALTLSLGEKSKEVYKRFKDLGADRYLLRHETISKEHYEKLHPDNLSYDKRLRCLYDLKELGYQVGCGFMVKSPYQRDEDLAKELLFIKEFSPHMVGIGPFIPQKDTPFCNFPKGSVEKTLLMLSLIRIMNENVLLPATTALATASEDGRISGIRAGANVVMPNLSPDFAKSKYALYDNKKSSGEEGAEGIKLLEKNIEKAGCTLDFGRGDSLVKD